MSKIKFKKINSEELKDVFINNDNFVDRIDKIRVSLYSSEEIMNISSGEVKNPETIHYKTHIPVKDGLYCQKIFGPVKNWSCSCGKYVGKIFKDVVCTECGVKVDSNNTRRERIGHIELSSPVLHSWYYLGNYNNYLSIIFNCENRNIAEIIHYEKFILPDKDFQNNFKLSIINKNQFNSLDDEEKKKVLLGVEGISKILEAIDVKKLLKFIEESSKKRDTKRINFLKNIIEKKTDITRIIIKVLPVLPCDLRPIIPLNNGVLGTTDINHLYRLVILRSNRIKVLSSIRVPEIILRHSKIILQKAVDALFDNNRLKKPVKSKERNLKSIADELSGKQGILRSNLLGKRVDFSARSVIVIDPKLNINECSLPVEMAVELFKLEISRKLLQKDSLITLNEAMEKIEKLTPDVVAILRDIIKNRSILLNRAPTLHRNSLQAFNIKLTEGRAIKIHPLICEGFNADCDGDLMAVYLSILPSTIIENKVLMSVVNNIFSFANGSSLVRPVREILMGCYYVTFLEKDEYKNVIRSISHVLKLYENKLINLHSKIKVVINKEVVTTTTGRVLINECLPEEFRNYNVIFNKRFIEKITIQIFNKLGNEKAAEILDKIKDFGFFYSSKCSLTLSLDDMITPSNKDLEVEETTKKSLEINYLFDNKFLTLEEKRKLNIQNWSSTIEKLKDDMREESKTNPLNDLFVSVDSGARGSIEQPRQLSIMRGLIADTTGEIIDYPVISSYKNGLNPIEYFISSYGARKGAADRALKTANAGYLTRKIVVLSSGIFISEYNCKTNKGVILDDIINEKGELVISKYKRILGRVILNKVLDIPKDKILDETDVLKLKESNITPEIRSVITCQSENLCSLCYGIDLARKCMISIGAPVGIIAAQSIGEPALQLTMRTFHTGGATLSEKNNSILLAEEKGFASEINSKLISIKNNNFYKFIVREKGYFVFNEKRYELEKGDFLHFDLNEMKKKNDILCTKNLYSEIFFSEKKGRLKIVEGNVSKLNNENICLTKVVISIAEQIIVLPKNSILFFNPRDKVEIDDIIGKRFHNLNVSKDIVDSLKQVEHIIEMRKVKDSVSIQANKSGIFDFDVVEDGNIKPYITVDEKKYELEKSCNIESLIVKKGQLVKKGQKITFGNIDCNKILNIFTPHEAKMFILDSIKEKYLEREIQIDDKHIEIVVRKMFGFGVITKSDTYKFSIGNLYPINQIEEFNKLNNLKVEYSIRCLGITKACLNSSSFISATSFQNTKNILAEAAFFNKEDDLIGIEENMLVGNPIPAGTGMKNISKVINEKLTKNDKDLNLSLFLKKVNPFYFVNICLDELNKKEASYIENNNNWVEDIIQETKKRIVSDYSILN